MERSGRAASSPDSAPGVHDPVAEAAVRDRSEHDAPPARSFSTSAGEEAEPPASPPPETEELRTQPSKRRARLSDGMGLRARVTATFAIGALALSTLMAGITYFAARQAFLNEHQSANQHQAFVNTSLIKNSLRSPGVNIEQLIGSVDTLPGSLSVLHAGGQWYATSISVSQSALPAELRTLVLGGQAASQIVSIDGTPEQVIGVPLPSVHATYFEVFSLNELDNTLGTLAIALAAAALVTTIAGAALGRWASGRAVRPLSRVTDAAVAIASGRLDTRVDAGEDVDLQELASAFNRMTGNLVERIGAKRASPQT